MAGNVHDEAVADPPGGPQAALAANHGAHELVRMQAALHQGFRLAGLHEVDGRLPQQHGCAAASTMRNPEISLPSASATASILALGPTEDRLDQAELDRLEHGAQGCRIAGVRHGDLQLRNRLRGRHEPVVLVVLPLTMLRHTLG